MISRDHYPHLHEGLETYSAMVTEWQARRTPQTQVAPPNHTFVDNGTVLPYDWKTMFADVMAEETGGAVTQVSQSPYDDSTPRADVYVRDEITEAYRLVSKEFWAQRPPKPAAALAASISIGGFAADLVQPRYGHSQLNPRERGALLEALELGVANRAFMASVLARAHQGWMPSPHTSGVYEELAAGGTTPLTPDNHKCVLRLGVHEVARTQPLAAYALGIKC